ncbi:hypothetical protein EJB05_20928, partial [Eragrostis curvula]
MASFTNNEIYTAVQPRHRKDVPSIPANSPGLPIYLWLTMYFDIRWRFNMIKRAKHKYR